MITFKKVNTLLFIALLLCASCGAQTKLQSLDFYAFKETVTALRYHVQGVDSFLIAYAHSGSYMEPAVGRIICEIDSSRKDTMRVWSSGKDTTWIMYGRKNCREDTAAYRRERHYYSHIQVYRIKDGRKTPIGKPMEGYYVEGGCFEDVPDTWVNEAKKNRTLPK